MNNHSFHKTRFAPTPSGFLHLGNVYSFAVTVALAKKHGAKILLRIDDMDRERFDKIYVTDIFDTLNFLGMHWQEGPGNVQEYEGQFSQVHRMGIYNNVLELLKEEGRVFACTCSRADVQRINPDHTYPGTCRHKNLPLDAANTCWRMKTDEEIGIIVNNVGEEARTTLPHTMREFVVKRRDGMPGYQLTSMLDDIYFGVDLIVRGQDLWDSTLAQLYLASVLGRKDFLATTFHHHPLIMSPDGSKLSKSAGATSIQHLRKEGKTATDILRMLKLDWNN